MTASIFFPFFSRHNRGQPHSKRNPLANFARHKHRDGRRVTDTEGGWNPIRKVTHTDRYGGNASRGHVANVFQQIGANFCDERSVKLSLSACQMHYNNTTVGNNTVFGPNVVEFCGLCSRRAKMTNYRVLHLTLISIRKKRHR